MVRDDSGFEYEEHSPVAGHVGFSAALSAGRGQLLQGDLTLDGPMRWGLDTGTGSADRLHARGIGAKLPAQRPNNDINDVARRRASGFPNRFHEVVATHGFSRTFLQVTHDAKFERRQPDAA